jgi:hypothetical protein
MNTATSDRTNWRVAAGGIVVGLLLAFSPILYPPFFLGLGLMAYLQPRPHSAILLLPSLGILVAAMALAAALKKFSFLKGLLIAGSFAALFVATEFYTVIYWLQLMRSTP